jgi:type IV secretion system protein TrbL
VSALGTVTGTLSGVAGGDPLGGVASGAADTVAGLGLHAISAWVLDGTKAALQEVASVIGAATAPNLESTWFSGTYWRVAGLAAILTIPFLCAAAVQSLARSDLMLLARVVFGYLPLSLIGVSLAAPMTMLLLAATDQMSAAVSATAVAGGAGFLDKAAAAAGAMSALNGSPFFAVVVGMLAVMAALGVALELLVRAAAVYVVVLMLPLAFAALVWPARRIWAARLVELLVSLILSKFVIVAVLSLASAAFAGNNAGISQLLTAMALLLLAAFAPWALMRILPFTELAAGAAGLLRHELPSAGGRAFSLASMVGGGAEELATALPARLRQQASDMDPGFASHGPTPSSAHEQSAPPGPAEAQSQWMTAEPAGQAPLESEQVPATEPTPDADTRPPYVPPEFITRDEPVRIGPELSATPFDQAKDSDNPNPKEGDE